MSPRLSPEKRALAAMVRDFSLRLAERRRAALWGEAAEDPWTTMAWKAMNRRLGIDADKEAPPREDDESEVES